MSPSNDLTACAFFCVNSAGDGMHKASTCSCASASKWGKDGDVACRSTRASKFRCAFGIQKFRLPLDLALSCEATFGCAEIPARAHEAASHLHFLVEKFVPAASVFQSRILDRIETVSEPDLLVTPTTRTLDIEYPTPPNAAASWNVA